MIDQKDEGVATNERPVFVARQAHREGAKAVAAARLAGLGHWEWDLDSDTVCASDELCRLHGLAPGDLDGTYAAFLARIHPDDRAGTDHALRGALAEAAFEHEHRILLGDGLIRVLRSRGQVVSDERGRAAQVFGVSWDVTSERAPAGAAAPRLWSFPDVAGRQRALEHMTLLARASRLLASTDLRPALEAIAHAALPVLGPLAAVDLLSQGSMSRLVEARASSDAWLEEPAHLAGPAASGPARTEVVTAGSRCRLTTPIALRDRRLGSLSFVAPPSRTFVADEVELAEDLADRIALAVDDADAHERARNELAEREQLLYMAAHELRAPLTSLRLCVEALRRNQAVASKAMRQIEVIDRDERRIARLVEDLLDLGRIRSGQLHLDLVPVDLRDLVGEVSRRMAVEIARSGSPINCSPGGPVIGRWDRSRLDQVVTNLLVNAVKFGQGKPIEVRLGCDGRRARLVVADQGIGIAPELHQRIFELFARANDARQHGGLGLGLYIVRTIVERLGGEVRVESEEGRGARFTVELPIESA